MLDILRKSPLVVWVAFLLQITFSKAQPIRGIEDDFEPPQSITTWFGDQCALQQPVSNPFPNPDNPSGMVLRYHDQGGQYANIRFDIGGYWELSAHSRFRLKVYIPGSGLTGNQNPRISLKLQNNLLPAPWSTQCEIIHPLQINQWQDVLFDFNRDPWINLNPSSLNPRTRTDFNRIVIQINGENNNDQVLAYLDNFQHDTTGYYQGRYALVWSDEFQTEGACDSNKWFAQTLLPNGNSWYNNEIQHYTNLPSNAYVSNGTLKIVARRENFTQQGITKSMTSARLNSKAAWRYGRMECRAKVPATAGTWPAYWTLGRNITEPGAYWSNMGFGTQPWPDCGEIDIMEHWGTQPNRVHHAVHTLSSSGATQNTFSQMLTGATTDFHLYSLIWTPEKLTFQVDSITTYTYQPSNRNASTWPFQSPQYLLLNVAMLASAPSSFQRDSLLVDYVRVYQDSLDLPGSSVLTGEMRYANTPGTPLHSGQIRLYLGNRWVADSVLAPTGRFGFYGLATGSYRIEAACNQAHGGINASDALGVMHHYAQTQLLQALPQLAADVNQSQTINASDALLIARRYSGIINSFPAGDWVFSSANTAALPVSGLRHSLIQALCTGDVNGSYQP
jgi:beta-glucanase (GH16 family)